MRTFVRLWVVQLYKSALGNIFDDEDWGPLDFGIMAKHYERQGKAPYSYHSVSVYQFLALHFLLKFLFSMNE